MTSTEAIEALKTALQEISEQEKLQNIRMYGLGTIARLALDATKDIDDWCILPVPEDLIRTIRLLSPEFLGLQMATAERPQTTLVIAEKRFNGIVICTVPSAQDANLLLCLWNWAAEIKDSGAFAKQVNKLLAK